MTEQTNPSLMAHVSIGTNDFDKAVEFYDKVLGVLGAQRIVDKFHATGLAAGAVDDGLPGPRIEYSEAYYGAFLHDLEGHKIEAMYWDFSKAPVSAG